MAHSLSGGLFKNVTFMPKTTPQCGVFMATVAEIFPGAAEMDRTNQSVEIQNDFGCTVSGLESHSLLKRFQ